MFKGPFKGMNKKNKKLFKWSWKVLSKSRTPAADGRPLPNVFSTARERLEDLKAILDDSFMF